MAAVAKAVRIGSGFQNEENIVRVVYDFAVDGGATATLDLGTAVQACMVTGFYAVVKTACTSGGSATVQVGDTNDDDRYLTATAVASLTANATFGENGAFNQVVRLAAGDKLTMTIATAALTAGKIEFVFKVAAA